MITMRNTCTLIHQTIRIPAKIDPSTFKKVVPAMAGEA